MIKMMDPTTILAVISVFGILGQYAGQFRGPGRRSCRPSFSFQTGVSVGIELESVGDRHVDAGTESAGVFRRHVRNEIITDIISRYRLLKFARMIRNPCSHRHISVGCLASFQRADHVRALRAWAFRTQSTRRVVA